MAKRRYRKRRNAGFTKLPNQKYPSVPSWLKKFAQTLVVGAGAQMYKNSTLTIDPPKRKFNNKKKSASTVSISAAGHSNSYYTNKFRNAFQEKVYKQLPTHGNIQNTAYGDTCGLGRQKFRMVYLTCEANDLISFRNATITGGGATISDDVDYPVYIDNVQGKAMITNASNGLNVITFYEIACKSTSIIDPVTLIQTSADRKTGGTNEHLRMGYSASAASEFMTKFRIVKSWTRVLQAGETHVHTYKYNYKKTFNPSYYSYELQNAANSTFGSVSTLANLPYLAGWTRGLLIRWHGQPIEEIGADNVTTDDIRINVVYSEKQMYKFLSSTTTRVSPGSNLLTSLSGGGQMMNPVTGEKNDEEDL